MLFIRKGRKGRKGRKNTKSIKLRFALFALFAFFADHCFCQICTQRHWFPAKNMPE
jgi:hypothetical protein